MVSVIQADAENFVRIRDGWTQPESLRLQAEFGRKCIPARASSARSPSGPNANLPEARAYHESLRINNQRVYKDADFPATIRVVTHEFQ